MPRSSFSIAPCLAGQSATPSAAFRSLHRISNDLQPTDNSQRPLSASLGRCQGLYIPRASPAAKFLDISHVGKHNQPQRVRQQGRAEGRLAAGAARHNQGQRLRSPGLAEGVIAGSQLTRCPHGRQNAGCRTRAAGAVHGPNSMLCASIGSGSCSLFADGHSGALAYWDLSGCANSASLFC